MVNRLSSLVLAVKDIILNDDKGVVITKRNAGKKEVVDRNAKELRGIYKNDSLVGAGIDYTASFVAGAGVTITLYDINDSAIEDLEFKRLLRVSRINTLIRDVVKDMTVIGDAYIEKVKGTGTDKFVQLTARKPDEIKVTRDIHDNPLSYIQEIGDNPSEYPEFEPQELIHFKNRGMTGEAYGISDISAVIGNAEILRDMSTDLANFIATKAYPPILWKLGTAEKPWGKPNVEKWGNARAEPEAGDQISVSGDIDAQAVGVSKEALQIGEYLKFYAALIVSGLRIPATLTSMDTSIGQFTADAQTNAYKRRIADMRVYIEELLQVEFIDAYIAQAGLSDGTYAVITWNTHEGEESRLAVNDGIQLLQNGAISMEELRMATGWSVEVIGELKKAIDNTEGTNAGVDTNANQNSMNESADGDGRTGQKRSNVEE
jgi:hypothetical protein